ncbi:OmpA family protein [Roseivirga sp. E12]|uniref:OmpA family protein n=1 Tax=Roseivirga sp. E12 TaxID=2819237 RepID=UPI001ABC0A17|nr:OmpA family protein [Roseivirga sp. E12]MBO3697401.1 OmpA family protein [Roseivirga sp. E12]
MRLFILLIGFSMLTSFEGTAQSSGEPSFVQSIYFGGGSFYVSARQSERLQYVLDSIPNIHNFVITVHSHTDNIGGKEYNEWLSEMRSDSVIEELILNEKVKKEVIEKRDFGLFNPIHDNRTWQGRRRNRRVDIIFWLAI